MMRKRAKQMGNKCEEDVFKLMNNACFGKVYIYYEALYFVILIYFLRLVRMLEDM